MARLVKCPVCGSMNNKEDTEEYGKRYYCPSCLKTKLEQSEARRSDWDRLFKYICKVYNIETLTGMMYKQLKEYRDEYGYKDSGMYATLRYYYDILGNEVLEGSGVGIIPYYYDKAREYYKQCAEVEKSLDNYVESSDIEVVSNVNNRIKLSNKNKIKLLSFD